MVSIRTPRAGRDKALCQTCATDISVSIRTPRAGRDAPRAGRAEMAEMVSIRTPRAGRDLMFSHDTYSTAHLFLSARPGRGATNGRYIVMADYPVSIRTPRAGRDPATASAATCWQSFYPHAPGGARHQLLHRCRHLGSSFYPHAPGGARPPLVVARLAREVVSIRTPRAGRDIQHQHSTALNRLFLSARPGRGATRWG